MLPRSVPTTSGAQPPGSARRSVGALYLETATGEDDDDRDDGKKAKYGGIGASAAASSHHRLLSPRTALVVLALCAGAAALGALSNHSNKNRYDPTDPMSGPPPSRERWRARRAWQQSPEGQLWKRAPPRVPKPNEERPPVDLQHEQQKQDMQRLQARQGQDEGQQQQQAPPPEPQGPPPKPSSYRPFRVLCFGDGLTAGFYGSGKDQHPYAMAMAAGLKQRFNGRYGNNEPPLEVETVVRGASGETVLAVAEEEGAEGGNGGGDNANKNANAKAPTMPERLEIILKEEEQAGRKFDAVVILGGSNDLFSHDETPQKLLEAIRGMWRRARRGHGAPTLVLTLPPDGAEEGKEQRDRDRAELNRLIVDTIREIVDKEKQDGGGGDNGKNALPPLRAEDIFPILTYSRGSPGDFFDDEVRLSPAGSDRLGDHVAHGIVEMGALEPYREKRLEADAQAEAAAKEGGQEQQQDSQQQDQQQDHQQQQDQQQQQEESQDQQQEEAPKHQEEAGGGGDNKADGNNNNDNEEGQQQQQQQEEEAAVVRKTDEQDRQQQHQDPEQDNQGQDNNQEAEDQQQQQQRDDNGA